jgi:hypothetical protein
MNDANRNKADMAVTLRVLPPYLPPTIFVADRQLQLFQPFHLWHILPGFSFTAFLKLLQNAASLARAALLNAFFFIPSTSFPRLLPVLTSGNAVNQVLLQRGRHVSTGRNGLHQDTA